MPSCYSHYYFGQLVLKELPNNIQTRIKKNIDLYNVGQNGPDILLYHAPLKGSDIARQNHLIHQMTGQVFFNNIDFNALDDKHYSYMMGYLCHFVLDSYCHPYIEQYKQEHHLSHMKIERELERYLLEKNHLNPFHYSLTNHIKINKSNASVMKDYVDHATTNDLIKTLWQMKIMYAFTKPTNKWKRKIVYAWMDYIQKPFLKDFVFEEQPLENCQQSNEELESLMNEAMQTAIQMITLNSIENPIFNEIFG